MRVFGCVAMLGVARTVGSRLVAKEHVIKHTARERAVIEDQGTPQKHEMHPAR